MLRPNSVKVIHINGRQTDERTITNTNAYLAAYVAILVISVLVVSIDRVSLVTSFSSVLACMNNIGPGLEIVGPTGTYADLSALSKVVLIVDMLAGRLEIFPIMILLSGKTWKRY